MNILFYMIAFFAEIIGTISGFGSSTIALPLSLLLFDFKTALVLVAFLHIFGNFGRLHFFKYGVDKNIFIKFGIASVIFAAVGSFLVNYMPSPILKGILGIFLVVYVVIAWFKSFTITPRDTTLMFGGCLTGFFAGLIGTGGALRGAFVSRLPVTKEQYIATMAAIALVVDLTRLPIYLKLGFLDSSFYAFIPILFMVAMVGSFIGRQIVDKISQEKFKKVVLFVLFLVGIKFIVDLIFMC